MMMRKIGELLWVVDAPDDKGHDIRIRYRPGNRRFKYSVYCDQHHLNSWASLEGAQEHVERLLKNFENQ